MPIGSASEPTARVELVGVVRLDERVEAELGRAAPSAPRRGRRRGRAGAGARRRRPPRAARRARPPRGRTPWRAAAAPSPARAAREIVDRAAEALVDEDRDRGRACPLERRGERGRIGVRPQVARRRRAALDLGDRGQPRRGERVPEPPTTPPPARIARTRSARRAARGRARVDRLARALEPLAQILGVTRRRRSRRPR